MSRSPDATVRAAIAVATPDSPAFEAELSEPIRFRWRDVITPRVRTVAFDPSLPDQLTGRLRSGERITIRCSADDPNVVPAPRVTFGGDNDDAESDPAVDVDTYSWFAGGFESSPLETPSLVKEATELGAFLAVAAPEYLGWIQEVASDLVPTNLPINSSRAVPILSFRAASRRRFRCPRSYWESSSFTRQVISTSPSPASSRRSTMGAMPSFIISPARKTGRPIDRILLAFHAWVNICAFYERCLENNLDRDGWAERSLSAMKKETNELRDGLAKSKALTAHGRALWTPFFE